MAQQRYNPKWILILAANQPVRVKTCHSSSGIPYYTRSLFIDIRRAISPAVSERLRVTESQTHCKLSLSVADPLQRDANQVHLPATQRLLAAHHASEQRGRSLQLPRYGHEITNYHTRCGAIVFACLVQLLCGALGWGDGKTCGETEGQRQKENCTLRLRDTCSTGCMFYRKTLEELGVQRY